MVFKHPVMNQTLFDCLQHSVFSEQTLLFIHHNFGNNETAEKTELHSN